MKTLLIIMIVLFFPINCADSVTRTSFIPTVSVDNADEWQFIILGDYNQNAKTYFLFAPIKNYETHLSAEDISSCNAERESLLASIW